MTTAPTQVVSAPLGTGLTVFGLFVAVLALWLAGVSAGGSARKAINLLLGVILVGVIIMNWGKIGPLLIKGGATGS